MNKKNVTDHLYPTSWHNKEILTKIALQAFPRQQNITQITESPKHSH